MSNEHYMQWYTKGLDALVSAAVASEQSSSGYAALATDPELKAMLESGAQTAGRHTDGIKALLRNAGGEPSGMTNKVIEGIIEAGKDIVGAAHDSGVRDMAVIDTSQIALHYYIAAYAMLAATAKRLGMDEDAATMTAMTGYMKSKDADYTRAAAQILSR